MHSLLLGTQSVVLMGCFIRGSYPQTSFKFVWSLVPSVHSLLHEEELLATVSVHTEMWRVDMCNSPSAHMCIRTGML